MSHDQRPGRMRVVQDSAKSQGDRRRAEGSEGGGAADSDGALGASADLVQGGAAVGGSAKRGLPLLQAAMFLAACGIGGVVIALVRPFGMG